MSQGVSKLAEYKRQLPPGLTREQQRLAVNDLAAQDLYLEAVPKVFTASAACKVAGVHLGHLARWRRDSADFVERERLARDQIADQLEAEAIHRAVKGERRPVYQGGLLAGYVQEKSDPLLAMLLKGHKPEKYRERSEVTQRAIVKVVAGFDPEDVL